MFWNVMALFVLLILLQAWDMSSSMLKTNLLLLAAPYQVSYPVMSEALTLLKALKQAESHQWRNIFIRMNALHTINFITSAAVHWHINTIIANIKFLIEKLNVVHLSHMSRSSNCKYHDLTNFARTTRFFSFCMTEERGSSPNPLSIFLQ